MTHRARPGMGLSIAALAFLPVLVVVATGSCSTAQEAIPDRAGPGETASLTGKSQAGPAETYLAIGDRLKITFFELIDVSSGGNAAPNALAVQSAAFSSFYQRMDLSGEYQIDQGGAISLPRLGRFQSQGIDLRGLQPDLAIAFERVTGRMADVSVTIVERAPVYVVGPVRNPGAHKYIPGMTVLQAVALAGGLDQGLGRLSELIESMREAERLRKASDQLTRLLARRARLEAERKGLDSIGQPLQVVALAGDVRRSRLAAAARRPV